MAVRMRQVATGRELSSKFATDGEAAFELQFASIRCIVDPRSLLNTSAYVG